MPLQLSILVQVEYPLTHLACFSLHWIAQNPYDPIIGSHDPLEMALAWMTRCCSLLLKGPLVSADPSVSHQSRPHGQLLHHPRMTVPHRSD